jgi:hypothetical protein
MELVKDSSDVIKGPQLKKMSASARETTLVLLVCPRQQLSERPAVMIAAVLNSSDYQQFGE